MSMKTKRGIIWDDAFGTHKKGRRKSKTCMMEQSFSVTDKEIK